VVVTDSVRFKQKLLNLVVLYSAQTRKREGQNKLNEIKHMLTSSGQEPAPLNPELGQLLRAAAIKQQMNSGSDIKWLYM